MTTEEWIDEAEAVLKEAKDISSVEDVLSAHHKLNFIIDEALDLEEDTPASNALLREIDEVFYKLPIVDVKQLSMSDTALIKNPATNLDGSGLLLIRLMLGRALTNLSNTRHPSDLDDAMAEISRNTSTAAFHIINKQP